MKLVFSHENRFIVYNARNIIQNAGIDFVLKNEFIGAAAGDLSPFDTWLELWVETGSDFERANTLITEIEQQNHTYEWLCHQCNETNSAAFELCWQCQHPRPSQA